MPTSGRKTPETFIVKNEKSSPRSHDLLFLLGICKKYDESLLSLIDTLTILNEYSVSARYPNDFEDKRTVDEAKEIYGYICEVKNVIQTSFVKYK